MRARRKKLISNAEIAAGLFLICCSGLLVAMLCNLGPLGRSWSGRTRIEVLFTQANGAQRETPVEYNGLEIGHVADVSIVRVTPDLLARLSALSRQDIDNLPLDETERATLRALPEKELPARIRAAILGKTVVLLALDVMDEQDAARFHADDEYRISSDMTGDRAVSIRSGHGAAIAAGPQRLFIGVGGDMYTDLARSVTQVRDILTSMSDVVSGDAGKIALRGQLGSFEQGVLHYDNLSRSIEEKLPGTFDSIDKRIDSFKKAVADVQTNIEKATPQIDEAFKGAQARITESHKSVVDALDDGKKRVVSIRTSTADSLKKWRATIAEYKDALPEQIHAGRDWSERFLPTVERMDAFLSSTDDQLGKGAEGTRATLKELNTQALNFEEVAYRLWHWPWRYANKPAADAAEAQNKLWRLDLARRGYLEMRTEVQGINAPRVQDGLRDIDSSLDAPAKSANADGRR